MSKKISEVTLTFNTKEMKFKKPIKRGVFRNMLTYFSLFEPCDYSKTFEVYDKIMRDSKLLRSKVSLTTNTVYKSRVLDLACKSMLIKKALSKEEERANKKLNKKNKLIVITSGLSGLKDSPAFFVIDGFIRALLRSSFNSNCLLDTHDVLVVPVLNPEGSALGLG